MNLVDPIHVWENDSLALADDGKVYTYIAYRDAEDCADYYGYGNTPTEAIEDFLRQEAEQICSNCTDPCSMESMNCSTLLAMNDCILIEPNLSTWLRKWMEEDDTSHRVWRELNGPLAFKPASHLSTKNRKSCP